MTLEQRCADDDDGALILRRSLGSCHIPEAFELFASNAFVVGFLIYVWDWDAIDDSHTFLSPE